MNHKGSDILYIKIVGEKQFVSTSIIPAKIADQKLNKVLCHEPLGN